MAEVEGLIERIKNESKAEGRVEGMKNIIGRILETHSLKETAKIIQMEEKEILHIINR